MCKKQIITLISLFCCLYGVSAQKPFEYGLSVTKPFIRPGMMQSREDLEYMKQQVLAGEQPWKDAFERLKNQATLDFEPTPYTHIFIGPYGSNNIGGRELNRNSKQAYDHALMWYITGNKAHADKTIEIINAWSYRLWDLDGNDAKLYVAQYGIPFLYAAEILKYSNSGWNEKDMEQFTRLVLTVFYPVVKDFFTEANGNWDACIMNIMLCIGIWTDNHEIFNRAIDRFCWGVGNSGITKYIYPTGQCQEVTRDWGHVQLGIGELARAAQVAWTQRVDLFGVADNRLAMGFEYTSKFLLGGEIPVFGVLSYRAKENFRDYYELVYYHYNQLKGIELPYTKEVVEKQTRPKSSIGILTGIRAPKQQPANKQPITPDARAKMPSATGALETAKANPPQGSVVIQPGQSIQEAIGKNKNSNKWIILAKGVHSLDKPLQMESGITLAGQGKESILFLNPEIETETIRNASNDMRDVTIRDLLIEGYIKTATANDPNQERRLRSYMSAPSRGGILFSADTDNQMQNIRFENVTVQNCTKNGVSVRGAANVQVINCDFSDNGSGVVPGAGFHHNLHLTHSSDCEIKNSRFDTSPWGNGINITFCSNVILSDNEAARNKLSGIRCADSKNIQVFRNLVEGNDESGILFDALMDGSKNITINENLSQNNGHYGIFVCNTTEASLHNNQSSANKRY
jgi:parallel beta-helix repeat protein